MKKYGIATIFGLLLVLFFAYILHPLNNGAIGVLTILCVGGCNGVAALIKKPKNDKGV